MPTTFTGLALFLVALAPGFAYGALRGSRYPDRASSTFRETGRVVLASCACDAGAIAVFWGLRALVPQHTFDVGALARAGWPYLQAHYQSAVLWGVLLLTTAVAIAVAAALTLPRRLGPLAVESSWWLLFSEYSRRNRARAIHVGCELIDGSHISGTLLHFAYQDRETPDRELALAVPLRYRPPGSQVEHELTGTAAVSVSARQIKFLTVAYLGPVAEPPRPATVPERSCGEDVVVAKPQPDASGTKEEERSGAGEELALTSQVAFRGVTEDRRTWAAQAVVS